MIKLQIYISAWNFLVYNPLTKFLLFNYLIKNPAENLLIVCKHFGDEIETTSQSNRKGFIKWQQNIWWCLKLRWKPHRSYPQDFHLRSLPSNVFLAAQFNLLACNKGAVSESWGTLYWTDRRRIMRWQRILELNVRTPLDCVLLDFVSSHVCKWFYFNWIIIPLLRKSLQRNAKLEGFRI